MLLEWRIAAPDHGIAGSVDFVGQLPDGSYALFDWKRAKGFSENLYANYGKIAKFVLVYEAGSMLWNCIIVCFCGV